MQSRILQIYPICGGAIFKSHLICHIGKVVQMPILPKICTTCKSMWKFQICSKLTHNAKLCANM